MKAVEGQIGRCRFVSVLRWLLIRLAACLLVCSPLVLIEVTLRLCVPDPGVVLKDPYVSFGGLRPLFVLNESGTSFETASERHFYFCPQSFSAAKKEGTFRIFCLGGSTVQGRPYSVETSFSTWLKLNLGLVYPEKTIEVVNCGGISYASYRLVPIMEELLTHEPDLIILCTGQNEFLEARTYHRLKKMPPGFISLHQTLLGLRTYSFANQWLASRQSRDTSPLVLPAEVQPKLDLETGLSTYHRDPVLRETVTKEFSHNLELLVQKAQHASVPLVLMNPVSNLKDCPPFKSELSDGLSPAERAFVTRLLEQARDMDSSDQWGKLRLLEQAVSLDNQQAGLLYQLGTCYVSTGQFSEAKKYFIAAKEQDVCPLRMLESMHDSIMEVATRYKLPLVDMRELIEVKSTHRIPDQEWLLDHVHPNINGHQLIADALTDVIIKTQQMPVSESWRDQQNQLWQAHLLSLKEGYYQEGFEHLMMLKTWSRRRGEIEKSSE